MTSQNGNQKAHIYFPRAYRHFKPNKKEQWLFLLFFVLPSLFLYLFLYTKISYAITAWVRQVLSKYILSSTLGIMDAEFLPLFGRVYYLSLPTKMPCLNEVAINLCVTLLLLLACFFFTKYKKGGTPVSVYFSLILMLHLVSCIYFMFAMEFFPYSATEYSALYIKQQVGIWLAVLILAGFVMGVIGYGNIIKRIAIFCGITTYSFLFGCVRYLVFMYIISVASSLYMATMFFILGPFFDFLYFVFIYAVYINVQIKHFHRGEGRIDWHWS